MQCCPKRAVVTPTPPTISAAERGLGQPDHISGNTAIALCY